MFNQKAFCISYTWFVKELGRSKLNEWPLCRNNVKHFLIVSTLNETSSMLHGEVLRKCHARAMKANTEAFYRYIKRTRIHKTTHPSDIVTENKEMVDLLPNCYIMV